MIAGNKSEALIWRPKKSQRITNKLNSGIREFANGSRSASRDGLQRQPPHNTKMIKNHTLNSALASHSRATL